MPKESASKHGLDRRLVYILPSVLALCIAIMTCAFVFRSNLFDLQYIHYTVYVEAPQDQASTDTDEKCLALINQIMLDNNVSGFTVCKSLEGAFVGENGVLRTQVSYQVILADIGKEKAAKIIGALREAFGVDVVLVEQSTTYSYYETSRGQFKTAKEAMGK